MVNTSGNITSRENQILCLMRDGLNAEEIAKELYISTLTVYTHRRNLIYKMKAKNSIDLVVKALRNDLIPLHI